MYVSSESNSTRAEELGMLLLAIIICFRLTLLLYVPTGRKPFSEPILRLESYMISSLA